MAERPGCDTRAVKIMDGGFAEQLLQEGRQLENRLITIRRELHRFPELGEMERRTAERVVHELQGLGCDVRTGVGGHGIVADLTGGASGKTIALRADMDALPIVEETGLAYASEVPGLMHACGHDLHTSILLGAATLLSRHRERLKGKVRLIFQPAEETLAGAKAMIRDGVLEEVSEIYGLHNQPHLPAGQIAVKTGALMAAADRLEVKLTGRGGHGAMPDQCRDPITAAAALILGLQTAANREMPPGEPHVISFGTIHAGTANNIIPDEAELSGTVRSLSPKTRDRLEALVYRVIEHTSASYGVQAEISYVRQAPALLNEPACTNRVRHTASMLLGDCNIMEAEAVMGAEDFAFYLEQIPGSYFWLGSGFHRPDGEVYGLHSSRYNPNEACMAHGAVLLAGLMMNRLG